MKKYLVLFLLIVNYFVSGQEKWGLKFYTESVNREFFVYADNDEYMPMSSQFKFKVANLTSSLPNNQIIVIPAKTKKFLVATLKPIKVNESNKLEFTNSFNFGDVTIKKYDSDYVYDLPFEKGKTQLIFQGYNGTFSHKNENALDFNLKVGEKVLAAREGTVVNVVDIFSQSCPTISCAKYNNKILIMHNDGTFGAYAHLKYKGSIVKKGDVITKGQHIGYSGNTGFSSGPHLHFMVFINAIDGSSISIKTQFKTSEHSGVFLEQGKSYTKNY